MPLWAGECDFKSGSLVHCFVQSLKTSVYFVCQSVLAAGNASDNGEYTSLRCCLVCVLIGLQCLNCTTPNSCLFHHAGICTVPCTHSGSPTNIYYIEWPEHIPKGSWDHWIAVVDNISQMSQARNCFIKYLRICWYIYTLSCSRKHLGAAGWSQSNEVFVFWSVAPRPPSECPGQAGPAGPRLHC